MLLGELRLPELPIMYSASLSNTVESVRIVVFPSHNPLLLGFETRLFLKFRNREGNTHKDVSRGGSRSRHVGNNVGVHSRVLQCGHQR